MPWPLTRRQVTRAGAASILGGLAGCQESGTKGTGVDGNNGPSQEPPPGVRVVEVDAVPNPVGQGQPIFVSVEFDNGFGEPMVDTVTLKLDGEPVDVTRETIPASERWRTSFTTRTGQLGTHTISARDRTTRVNVEPYPETFVETQGTNFVVEGEPFFFNGVNAPIGDPNYPQARSDEVISDAAEMGVTVIRAFAYCNGLPRPCHQPEPGVYDEAAFKKLDYLIYRAKVEGIRLVFPLVNNFSAHGGMTQYVDWVSEETYESEAEKHDAFYTDERAKRLYRDYVRYVLTRENTYTGVAYRDDPTIMMWELANEPDLGDNDGPLHTVQNWIEEMGAFIKDVDPNHLLSTGEQGFYDQSREQTDDRERLYLGARGTDFIRNHRPETIDACSMHFYPQNMGEPIEAGERFIEDRARDAHEVVGKPVYLGEFGYRIPRKGTDRETIEAAKRKRADVLNRYYRACDRHDVNGTLVWNLDGHNFARGELDYATDPEDEFTEIYYPEDDRAVSVIEEYSARMMVKTAERRGR